MSRITSAATCPRCGAQVQPAPGSDQVTCSYCGTTSFIQRAHAPQQAPLPVTKMSSALFIALGVSVAVTLGGAVAAYLLIGGRPTPKPAPTASEPFVETEQALIEQALAQPAADPFWIASDAPLLTDLNGDGTSDAVVRLATRGAGPSADHYAAFDGRSGAELARTPALTDSNATAVALVARQLVVASRNGQLVSYGLGDGKQQWTTALGARVTAFCTAKNPGSVLVSTDEDRRLLIDLVTGRQTETKEACSQILARASNDHDPRDRRDYSAPIGTESYRCGGVRVMGSQNYSVADQCLVRAKVDTDRLDAMIGHRLWRVAKGWLVMGIRKPGARVPMVGLVDRGKLAWKSEVPLDNPLDAEEGSPQAVGLSSNTVVLAYASGKDRRPFVTAFDVESGARRWTVPLPGKERVAALQASAERVFVQSGHELLLLDAADGKIVISIGQSS